MLAEASRLGASEEEVQAIFKDAIEEMRSDK
jgi:hypothetical protein